MKKLAYLALLALVALLAACGGGSGSNSAANGNVSLYVTDNLTQDYTEVWVTLHSVTTTDGTGQTVVLFEDTTGTGVVQNLRELAGVGSLLNTQSLAAGTYTDFTVTLDNQIKLVKADSTVTTATFDTTGSAQYTLTVTGTMTIAAGQNTAVALDFDLSNFTYDAQSNTVTPMVVYQDETQTQNLVRTFAEMEGHVVSIADATHFVMSPKHSGENINVTLHDSVVIYKEHASATSNDTSALQVGNEVEVYGNYDATTLTIEAVRIKVDDETSGEHMQSAEGTVVSFDGTNLVMDIHEADFMPGADTLTVDVSAAFFARGDSSMLIEGARVEIEGMWDSTGMVFTVAKVEIEGAPRNDDMDNVHDDMYAEIHGDITAIDGNSITVTITKAEDTGAMIGDTLVIDTTNAWFKEGDAACLTVGGSLEAKGSIDMNTMTAQVVEAECAGYGDDDLPKVKGTVVSLTGNTLVLTITSLKHFTGDTVPMVGDAITIDVTTARFKHGVIADLTAGAMVEVKGTWADNVLTAAQVEFGH
jgi:hypothetical protein